jgi:hypothetical protein
MVTATPRLPSIVAIGRAKRTTTPGSKTAWGAAAPPNARAQNRDRKATTSRRAGPAILTSLGTTSTLSEAAPVKRREGGSSGCRADDEGDADREVDVPFGTAEQDYLAAALSFEPALTFTP